MGPCATATHPAAPANSESYSHLAIISRAVLAENEAGPSGSSLLNERYDMGGEPGIVIEAYGSRPFDPTDQTWTNLCRWQVDTFPAEVLEHLFLTYLGGAAHAG